MTDTTTRTNDILEVLAAYRHAHTARDAAVVLGVCAEGAVRYTLAPPLQQTPSTDYGNVAGMQRWFATFDGPVGIEHRDPQVTASDDVAFVTSLTRLTATPAGAPASFSFWYRSTFGVRRLDGRWRIVHQHDSTPFHMDGSFRAATELEPA